MTTFNRRVLLASRPVGLPKTSDFQLEYGPIPSPAAGEVLVRSVYLSLDPYMRGRMSDRESYAPSVGIGEVMVGGAVGVVVASGAPEVGPGDVVVGMLGWQEYAVTRGSELRKLEPRPDPITTALGVLGMPGLTAFFGLLDVCAPKPNEVVVVSGAAGAVGMLVGQIAKLRKCRVVGVAGSDEKVAWLVGELGFDAAINYKTVSSLDEKLEELCPDGVDVYFDNVGGTTTDAVIRRIRTGARISVCGQISQYNLEAPESGPRWLGQLVVRQAKVQGFLVSAYAPRFPGARRQLGRWLKRGDLKYREDIAQGLESAPQAFIGMLEGRNLGKQLVQVSASNAMPESLESPASR
jgi:NADPH-dependent curcumin reductase CurA